MKDISAFVAAADAMLAWTPIGSAKAGPGRPKHPEPNEPSSARDDTATPPPPRPGAQKQPVTAAMKKDAFSAAIAAMKGAFTVHDLRKYLRQHHDAVLKSLGKTYISTEMYQRRRRGEIRLERESEKGQPNLYVRI